MFDREGHIKMMRSIMNDWSDQQLQKDADRMEEKYSHVKYGNNVIHIQYSGQIIETDDLYQVAKTLKEFDYELSSFNDDGIFYNCFANFASQVSMSLTDTTVNELLTGLSTNALWDVIKATTKTLWKKIEGKSSYTFESDETVVETKASLSIKLNISEFTSYEFDMFNVSEDVLEDSLSKILEFAKTAPRHSSPKRPGIIIYNPDKHDWEEVIFTPEVLQAPSRKFVKSMSFAEYKQQIRKS